MFVCWLLEALDALEGLDALDALDALEGLEALGFFEIGCKVTTFF